MQYVMARKFATQADFEESIEVVIAGYQKKNRVLSNKEKLIVSYHEIGHALGGGETDRICSGSQDYDYSTYLRRSWIHHAGG